MSLESKQHCDVCIVGGGLAGLCCALRLHRAGRDPLLLEATDRIGGRIKTDRVDGFLLDRGFQVFLTAYPEAKQLLAYPALDLGAFEPGALVRFSGKFRRVTDPWRRPRHAWQTALSPIGSLADKWRIWRLRQRLLGESVETVFQRPECPTRDRLREIGFSQAMIERFFEPFLGGVFLDRQLDTSSRMFEFVFRMFAEGDAALPAGGMEAIPRQLAAAVPGDAIRVSTRVERVSGNRVQLAEGGEISARAVVVATDPSGASRLVGSVDPRATNAVTCLYFAAPEPPLSEAVLVLGADDDGPVNNLCVPSNVRPEYAPPGSALISVSVLGDPATYDHQLEAAVRIQLRKWFGAAVDRWWCLRTYRVAEALPQYRPGDELPSTEAARSREGVFLCGDYCETPSIQGAMVSGRRAADAVLRALGDND